jgi:hypothetical protein
MHGLNHAYPSIGVGLWEFQHTFNIECSPRVFLFADLPFASLRSSLLLSVTKEKKILTIASLSEGRRLLGDDPVAS